MSSRRAAKLVQDGDRLILNAGTTMQALALQLKQRKDLRIVTNGLTVATELISLSGVQIQMLGGEVDLKKVGTVGPEAERMLEGIHVPRRSWEL